ncbi:MAG: hypothetical protein HS111_11990 [Kofleriaceae bacterium]|nr:hypothetical protein [Kofleriaceae bacterium]
MSAPVAEEPRPLVCELAAATGDAGGKAAGLARLRAAGLPVPDGFALTAAAFEAVTGAAAAAAPGLDDVGATLARWAEAALHAPLPRWRSRPPWWRAPGRWAVRSSCGRRWRSRTARGPRPRRRLLDRLRCARRRGVASGARGVGGEPDAAGRPLRPRRRRGRARWPRPAWSSSAGSPRAPRRLHPAAGPA